MFQSTFLVQVPKVHNSLNFSIETKIPKILLSVFYGTKEVKTFKLLQSILNDPKLFTVDWGQIDVRSKCLFFYKLVSYFWNWTIFIVFCSADLSSSSIKIPIEKSIGLPTFHFVLTAICCIKIYKSFNRKNMFVTFLLSFHKLYTKKP